MYSSPQHQQPRSSPPAVGARPNFAAANSLHVHEERLVRCEARGAMWYDSSVDIVTMSPAAVFVPLRGMVSRET
jgi:hypothetical protein